MTDTTHSRISTTAATPITSARLSGSDRSMAGMIDGAVLGAALVGSLSGGMKTPIEPMLLLPICPR